LDSLKKAISTYHGRIVKVAISPKPMDMIISLPDIAPCQGEIKQYKQIGPILSFEQRDQMTPVPDTLRRPSHIITAITFAWTILGL
jgi:hypothetical protein